MHHKRIVWVLAALLSPVLLSCSSPAQPASPSPESPPASTPIPTLIPLPTATPIPYPTPELSARPLVWFAPLPPLLVDDGRPYIGAEEYMDLFLPSAPWQETMQNIQVLELYGEWVHDAPWTEHASDQELKRVIDFANEHGLALALEASPLSLPNTCGAGFESWGGLQIGLEIAQRIQRLGGTLHFIAMDAPYYYAGLIDNPGACRWPAAKVAQEIDRFITGMQRVFPDVIVGDTEPLQGWTQVETYKQWMIAFREETGYNLPFFHMDLDYSRSDWPERVKELEDFARGEGIEFGILYFGSPNDPSDEAWLSNTGERVIRYELQAAGRPDHVLFQSWHDHPDLSMPEDDPYTYTGFIKRYFEDKAGLGFRSEGPGANLAIGKSVRASKSLRDSPAANVVDGNPDTLWGAGDFAPQWIEIDLGQAYTISEVRLRLSQSPAGMTIHRLSVKGPAEGDAFTELHTFEGETQEGDWLVYTLLEPLPGIRYLRVQTPQSPSWIGFWEIEVISAE